jgi:hypothetical protein
MSVVVAVRRFDLDDIGSQIGEQRRAIRPGENAREIQNS